MEPLFRFVIDAFCRARKLNDAVFAFETMKKLIDGKPSVVIYNVLIKVGILIRLWGFMRGWKGIE